MKTALKRLAVWAYCRGGISLALTQRIVDRFDLGAH